MPAAALLLLPGAAIYRQWLKRGVPCWSAWALEISRILSPGSGKGSPHLQAVVGPAGYLGAQEFDHLLHVRHAQQPRLAPRQDAHHHLRAMLVSSSANQEDRNDLLNSGRAPLHSCPSRQHLT